MDLQFVINSDTEDNIFLALVASNVSEPVLLGLTWHIPVEESMLVSVKMAIPDMN